MVLSVQPPSGTLIAHFEGAENATTLNCNIGDGMRQISTTWSIENYRGSTYLVDITSGPPPFVVSGDPLRPDNSNITFLNELTVSTWTADLDGATVSCGTGQDQREASFLFRVYRKLDISKNRGTNLELWIE